MFSLTTLIIVAVIALICGCLIGALLSKTLSPEQQKARSLETKLQASEERIKEYQQEVTDHFAETAKLVNTLTQSYRDVHEHLASDALKLANVDISRQLLGQAESDEGLMESNAVSEEHFQAPKDWAPQVPGRHGTLSESYGLKEEGEYSRAENAKPN